jgi:hypothetical protein
VAKVAVCSQKNKKNTLTLYREALTALFKDPVRTAL